MKRLNYFQIFGLRPSFILDQTSLHNRYKSLQKIFHPDITQIKDYQTTHDSSAEINYAYQTLSNKLSRALYMCELHGFQIQQGQQVQNEELLDRFFEWNARIMDNDLKVQDEIYEFYETTFNRIILLHLQINDRLPYTDISNQEKWTQIKTETETLCYLENLMTQIKDKA